MWTVISYVWTTGKDLLEWVWNVITTFILPLLGYITLGALVLLLAGGGIFVFGYLLIEVIPWADTDIDWWLVIAISYITSLIVLWLLDATGNLSNVS